MPVAGVPLVQSDLELADSERLGDGHLTRMLATLLVPWPRPRLSSDRAAIASPSRCCLLISNASCGLDGFGCAAHAVRKMSLRSPQSNLRRLAKLVARPPPAADACLA